MRLKSLLVAGFTLGASAVEAQRLAPYAAAPSASAEAWSFGPVMPHARDAVKRSAYGMVTGAMFMALGLGLDRLNSAQCNNGLQCMGGNPVQTGVSFAFLGTLIGATAPVLSSKCTRSGRAILGIVGAIVGVSAAGAIADVSLLNAMREEPATIRTMSAGLIGLGVGAGVATAIC